MSENQCEKCGERPAEITLTDVSGGEVHEIHVCRTCARAMGASIEGESSGFNVSKFIADIEDSSKEEQGEENEDVVCPVCGMLYSEFKNTGKLGCPSCYSSFAAELDPLIRRLHGSLTHGGRGPGESGTRKALQRELGSLRTQLADAVAKEDYEQAAQIRDDIKALKENSKAVQDTDDG